MDIQILHNGYDEIYDICQIHLLKLNDLQRCFNAFALSKNDKIGWEELLAFIKQFSMPNERLKLFFDIEYQEVSFMSQYFLKEKGIYKFKTSEEFEHLILKDTFFKGKVIEFYLGKQFESDREIQRALMVGYKELDDSYKVLIHDFLNFYDEYIDLLFTSMHKIQKEVKKEYQRSQLLLKRLQSTFDLSLIADNHKELNRWFKKHDRLELSFSICNKFIVMYGDGGTKQGWLLLGIEYVKMIEEQWKLHISLVEMCKALGDELRMEIVFEIQQYGELSASAVAKKFGQSVKAVFYHLEILKKAQILSSRTRGRNTYFSMNESTCDKFVEAIKFLGGNNNEQI